MEQIEIRGLRKAYTTHSTEILIDHEARPSRTRTVLRDLNVNFPAGRISVLVGRSGCGKSTLLRLINREEMPDGGEIRLPAGWRSVLLGANPYVITWTSVLRNVAMASGVGKTPEERLEHAADFVRLVGLEEFSDLTPDELSTGMKQRLGLARVLASQAQLLLMDEPFAALDFLTRAELQAELLHLQRRLPRTILLVTHQLDEALLLGDSVTVMHSDSSLRTFDLSGLPQSRDPESDALRRLRREITDECRL
jgi:sulfonate transport system ATP-binding protein